MSRHDENNICANANDWREAQKNLAEVTDAGDFRVEMVSDLAIGKDFGTQIDLSYNEDLDCWVTEENRLAPFAIESLP